MSRSLGMESDLVPRMATGFGGGMGGLGSVCGALTGGTMAISMKHGRDSGEGDRRAAYGRVQRLYRGFQEEMGSTICRDLTGFDISTREGYEQFRASGVSAQVCRKAVATAARLAEELAGYKQE